MRFASYSRLETTTFKAFENKTNENEHSHGVQKMAKSFFTNRDDSTLTKEFEGVLTNNPAIKNSDSVVGFLRASGNISLNRRFPQFHLQISRSPSLLLLTKSLLQRRRIRKQTLAIWNAKSTNSFTHSTT